MPLSPELSQYIAQARAAGMADDAIRTELLKAGWQVADVNEALPARVPSFAPVVAPEISPPAQFQGGPVSEAKPKRSHRGFYIIVILLLLIGGATYFFLPQIVPYIDKALEMVNPPNIAPVVVDDIVRPIVPVDEMASWQTYKNDGHGFEFKYPDFLKASTSNERFTLKHSIQYSHPNPCDFKGDAGPLDEFTDFDLSFEVRKTSIGELTSQFNLYLEPYSVGAVTFQSYSMGVEGCGQSAYYLSLSPDTTLVVTHAYVAEYNPVNSDHQAFLALPGVLSPEVINQTFQLIFSTFKLTSQATSTQP